MEKHFLFKRLITIRWGQLGEACMQAQSLSRVWRFATPWTVAHQAALSVGFLQQEFWSGLPFPPPEDLPTQGSSPSLLPWQGDSSLLTTWEAGWWCLLPSFELCGTLLWMMQKCRCLLSGWGRRRKLAFSCTRGLSRRVGVCCVHTETHWSPPPAFALCFQGDRSWRMLARSHHPSAQITPGCQVLGALSFAWWMSRSH